MNPNRILPAALVLAVLTGCAQQPVSRPAYPSPQPGWGYGQPVGQAPGWGQPQPAAQPVGRVTRIERVEQGGSGSPGVGTVAGGVVGAVVGRQFGGSASARNAGTVLGAVGGALIGHQIEQGQRPSAVTRVTVQFDDGNSRYFDYASLGDLRVGDRVRLQQDGQLYRY